MPAPSDMAREGIGFGASNREDVQEDAIKKMFTPEFRNRLDAVVPFGYLPPAVVARVVDKFILQLELQLADRSVHIDLDDEAREWLTERGYDKLYGARPMGRLVQEKIKQPLAEELLFGKLVNGGEVKVRIKDNAPAFEITPAPPKAGQGAQGARPSRRKARRQGRQKPARLIGALAPRRCNLLCLRPAIRRGMHDDIGELRVGGSWRLACSAAALAAPADGPNPLFTGRDLFDLSAREPTRRSAPTGAPSPTSAARPTS